MSSDVGTLAILGAVTAAYAAALSTEEGRRFTDDYTWASVVIGTTIVLLFLRLMLPAQYWQKVAMAFVVSGVPMVSRSFLKKMKTNQDVINTI